MDRLLLINAGVAQMRSAVVEDGRLQELFLDPLIGTGCQHGALPQGGDGQSLVGTVFLARVVRVMPALQAAFLDIGEDRAGFLGAREARPLAPASFAEGQAAPDIGACVREGQAVIVQAIKEPIGEKGARLSAAITLPGRFLVLMPGKPGLAVSHRIAGEKERARLAGLCAEVLAQSGPALADCGYIVRSAAAGASRAELQQDAERLSTAWGAILDRRKQAVAPAVLHQDLAPIERILRDAMTAGIDRVLIDDRAVLETARAYSRRIMPDAERKLEFSQGSVPLFDAFGLEDDISGLMLPRVRLPCGGWIIIESTEALTAIDVNSGNFLQADRREETGVRVNLEAAAEIARQIRLRGIGGLIVVDFIRLRDPANIRRLLAALTDSLARDRATSQVSMSPAGLVEITRKRLREPLEKLATGTCSACGGRGRQLTDETIAFDLLRAVERSAASAPGKSIVARASPQVVRWIGEHEAEIRNGLARRGAARVTFEPAEAYGREQYDVTTT